MPKLFSYVVHHDHGYAPNPSGRLCSLAKCKYGTTKPNIVELAEVGDWIAGTGGSDLKISAGHGKLIYAMRVDDKVPLAAYCQAYENQRIDANHNISEEGRFAILSKHFYYFGRNAVNVSEIPQKHLDHPFEKKGPGHRSDFSEEFIEEFASWLKRTFRPGVHGLPCQPHPATTIPSCKPKVKRKKRCP